MTVYNDFLTETEEKSLIDEIEPYMSELKYEFDHWDDVSCLIIWLIANKIVGYPWLSRN